MAVKRLSNLRIQYDDGNGALAASYRLFFYASGPSSSTKQNTYNDSTGVTPNTNPIVLNALGEPSVEIWLTAGLTYKLGLAIPGTDDPPASFVWNEDVISGLNDTSVSIDQWQPSGLTPTYVSATSFTLAGDQTSAFHPGRRLKTTNSGGTIYSSILTSVFGALTTITVVNDSGVLDSGLSAVNYSLLSKTNDSLPRGVTAFAPTVQVFTGSGTWTKPNFLIAAVIEIVGGGGGGGGAETTPGSQSSCGAGGGGGGYSRKRVAAATLGATETVTIGAGGIASTAGIATGGTGGTTSFGVHCTATGGSGGTGGNSSGATFSGTGAGGAGGVGASGDVNIKGGPGSNGFCGGAAERAVGGVGGDSVMGGGSTGAYVASGGSAGGTGGNYGGGGGGAANGNSAVNRAGGAGAPGLVIVTEYY